jgi:hypothetical protein
MRTHMIGVPSGVGDIYWCLAKIQSYRAKLGLERVLLGVQRTQHDRSVEWGRMVGFVDGAQYVRFNASGIALRQGFDPAPGVPGVDVVMWPNAVVDRGEHLCTWMPEYELNLDFKIATEQRNGRPGGDIVIYPSSRPVNKAWFPMLELAWWIELAQSLHALFNRRVTMIGSAWDAENCAGLRSVSESLIGYTSLAEVAWILEHAKLVIGVASGMTILANHFQTPCIALFPDKHHARFPWTWVKPGTPYSVYRASSIPSAVELAHEAFHLHATRAVA